MVSIFNKCLIHHLSRNKLTNNKTKRNEKERDIIKKLNKIALSIGALTTMVAPVAVVVSCGKTGGKVPAKAHHSKAGTTANTNVRTGTNNDGKTGTSTNTGVATKTNTGVVTKTNVLVNLV